MKKRVSLVAIFVAVLSIFLIVSPAAAQIADGTYQINYEMKESSSNNTSIADGYFSKPATLTVQDGVQTIQLTVTGSNYIQSLSAPSGPVKVISENTANQTRNVSFRVDGDLSNPVNMQMHIIVPDLYDQTHTARAVFNVSGLPQASETPAEDNSVTDNSATDSEEKTTAESNNDASAGDEVENPKTGEDTSILLYGFLMLASIVALFVIWKLRPGRN